MISSVCLRTMAVLVWIHHLQGPYSGLGMGNDGFSTADWPVQEAVLDAMNVWVRLQLPTTKGPDLS